MHTGLKKKGYPKTIPPWAVKVSERTVHLDTLYMYPPPPVLPICLSLLPISPLAVSDTPLLVQLRSHWCSPKVTLPVSLFDFFSAPFISHILSFLKQPLSLCLRAKHKLSAHFGFKAKGHWLRPPTYNALGATGISPPMFLTVNQQQVYFMPFCMHATVCLQKLVFIFSLSGYKICRLVSVFI